MIRGPGHRRAMEKFARRWGEQLTQASPSQSNCYHAFERDDHRHEP